MKQMIKTLLVAGALGLAAAGLIAQDGPPPQDGPHGPGGHRPPPPIIGVLDANHDGVIDADEIANASKALKKLDKNGDGKLTQDELRPPRPDGPGMGGPGPDGFGPDGPPPQE